MFVCDLLQSGDVLERLEEMPSPEVELGCAHIVDGGHPNAPGYFFTMSRINRAALNDIIDTF